jgi:hypothetical protein
VAVLLGEPRLEAAAERYDALAREWTALARAALPADVPALARTRALLDAKAAAWARGGPAERPAIDAAWNGLAALEREIADGGFPLTAEESRALLADLAGRVDALYEREVEARATI